ncbi:MAG: hypothetical protein NTZ10_04785 [Candidatus Saganbacteria bacterium]|nr:hypothetical protein [Candidatus Saganbacteria bacterium]
MASIDFEITVGGAKAKLKVDQQNIVDVKGNKELKAIPSVLERARAFIKDTDNNKTFSQAEINRGIEEAIKKGVPIKVVNGEVQISGPTPNPVATPTSTTENPKPVPAPKSGPKPADKPIAEPKPLTAANSTLSTDEALIKLFETIGGTKKGNGAEFTTTKPKLLGKTITKTELKVNGGKIEIIINGNKQKQDLDISKGIKIADLKNLGIEFKNADLGRLIDMVNLNGGNADGIITLDELQIFWARVQWFVNMSGRTSGNMSELYLSTAKQWNESGVTFRELTVADVAAIKKCHDTIGSLTLAQINNADAIRSWAFGTTSNVSTAGLGSMLDPIARTYYTTAKSYSDLADIKQKQSVLKGFVFASYFGKDLDSKFIEGYFGIKKSDELPVLKTEDVGPEAGKSLQAWLKKVLDKKVEIQKKDDKGKESKKAGEVRAFGYEMEGDAAKQIATRTEGEIKTNSNISKLNGQTYSADNSTCSLPDLIKKLINNKFIESQITVKEGLISPSDDRTKPVDVFGKLYAIDSERFSEAKVDERIKKGKYERETVEVVLEEYNAETLSDTGERMEKAPKKTIIKQGERYFIVNASGKCIEDDSTPRQLLGEIFKQQSVSSENVKFELHGTNGGYLYKVTKTAEKKSLSADDKMIVEATFESPAPRYITVSEYEKDKMVKEWMAEKVKEYSAKDEAEGVRGYSAFDFTQKLPPKVLLERANKNKKTASDVAKSGTQQKPATGPAVVMPPAAGAGAPQAGAAKEGDKGSKAIADKMLKDESGTTFAKMLVIKRNKFVKITTDQLTDENAESSATAVLEELKSEDKTLSDYRAILQEIAKRGQLTDPGKKYAAKLGVNVD